jgi:UDP-glucose 4-epimerase
MPEPLPQQHLHLLVTGGAGFIGSHVCLALLQAGHSVTVLDNFSTSRPQVLERVLRLSGVPPERLRLLEGDVREPGHLQAAFSAAPVAAVLHLAGLKSVAESVQRPHLYWQVNVQGSRALLAAMAAAGCRRLVFSSSAAVYGAPERMPIAETTPLQPLNPYGATKAAVEALLHAQVRQSEGPGLSGPAQPWRVACLRYFNAVGGHPSGALAEDPLLPPSNLFPLVCQVLSGQRRELEVCGDDWPTADGTGVRDYIHVQDLALGHQAALDWVLQPGAAYLAVNLGRGVGASVLEVLSAFAQQAGRPIHRRVVPRRPGDGAVSIADPSLAAAALGWRARHDLAAMARDALAGVAAPT